MKLIYFLTYLLNLIIIFLILFKFIDVNEYSFLFEDNFFNQNKTITIFILFAIYILLVVLNLPLTAFITTYSGAFLGVYETIFYVFFATSLGSYLSLIVNRYFFRRNQKILSKILKIKFPKPSILLIIFFKAIPVLPFSWVIIYTSTTNFSAKKFLIANFLGCLTTVTIFANLGNAIITNNFLQILIISLFFFTLAVIGYFFRKHYFKK